MSLKVTHNDPINEEIHEAGMAVSAAAGPKPKAKKAVEKTPRKSNGQTKATPKATPKAKRTAEVKEGVKASPKTAELSENQLKILKALKGTSVGNTLTRAQLREKTGVMAGYCKLIGSSTVEGGGRGAVTGLEPRGLVKSAAVEGSRGLSYYITAKGERAIAK